MNMSLAEIEKQRDLNVEENENIYFNTNF